MICTLHPPSDEMIRAFLRQQAAASFSYPEVGHTRYTPPAGYVVDHNRICLGKGEACFNAACDAIRAWRMFSLSWVTLCWPSAPIAPGTDVAVLARWGPLWWLNACRIVYVIDEQMTQRRFGFAYGTLPAHAERGGRAVLRRNGRRRDGLVRPVGVFQAQPTAHAPGLSAGTAHPKAFCRTVAEGDGRSGVFMASLR